MAKSFDSNSLHCRDCKAQVAFVDDYIDIVLNKIEHQILHILGSTPGGIFKTVRFNVGNYVNDNQPVIGNMVAETCCDQCKTILGWKFIAVSPENMFVREGRFLMKLNKLIVWNDQNADQDLGANEQIADQDLGGNGDEDGVVNKPDSAANYNVGQEGEDSGAEEDESCGSCDIESSVDENA